MAHRPLDVLFFSTFHAGKILERERERVKRIRKDQGPKTETQNNILKWEVQEKSGKTFRPTSFYISRKISIFQHYLFLITWVFALLINLFMIFPLLLTFFFYFFSSPQDLCQNYIRVLALPTPGTLLGCGTNAFRPLCRVYGINGNSYSVESEKPGQAVCPYDPAHNSTAVYVGKCFARFPKYVSGLLKVYKIWFIYKGK